MNTNTLENSASATCSPDSGASQRNGDNMSAGSSFSSAISQQHATPASNNNSFAVEAVGTMKLPPFWKDHVQLWFMQVEALFLSLTERTWCQRHVRANGYYYAAAGDRQIWQLNGVHHKTIHGITWATTAPSFVWTCAWRPEAVAAISTNENACWRNRWTSLLPQHIQQSLIVLRSASLEDQITVADELMEAEAGVFAMTTARPGDTVQRFSSRPSTNASHGRLEELERIIMQPPEIDKYDNLTASIIKRFTESPERQLHRALFELVLEDQKPSQLFRQMKMLAGGIVGLHCCRNTFNKAW